MSLLHSDERLNNSLLFTINLKYDLSPFTMISTIHDLYHGFSRCEMETESAFVHFSRAQSHSELLGESAEKTTTIRFNCPLSAPSFFSNGAMAGERHKESERHEGTNAGPGCSTSF